jgi:hypothetical protein
MVLHPDATGKIIVKFKCKNGKEFLEICEEVQECGETYFWSEPGEFNLSMLRNYSEFFVDVYLNNVLYYQKYLSV